MADAAESSSKRSKYVGIACGACKTTKKKCDGNNPCRTCVENNRQCVFDEGKDRRRGRKRTLDALHSKAEALDTVLDSLRSSDDTSIQELLQLIRSQASLTEITQLAKSVLAAIDFRSDQQDGSRTHRAVMSIAALTDEPPIRVPAKPWTDVTDDDNFVSHLISVFFTWHHSGYPSIDQDLFVREMNSKNLYSQFCSPILVSAILTAACFYTDHPSVFSDPDDQYTRGRHFLEEANRRWSLEEGTVSLTNLQTLPSVIMGNTVSGKDRISLLYVSQSIYLRTELERKVKVSLKAGNDEFASAEYQRSLSLAAWAAFLAEVEMAVAFVIPMEMRIPQSKRPWVDHEVRLTTQWRPYPKIGPEVSFAPNGVTDELYNLYQIGADILPLLLAGDPADSPLPGHVVLDRSVKQARLHSVARRLRDWEQRLPSYARFHPTDSSAIASPLVDLYLSYHTYQITVQQILLDDNDERKAFSDTATEMWRVRQQAKEEMTLACRNIGNLLKRVRNTIGLTCPMYTVQASTKSAYALMEFLHEPDIPDIFYALIVPLSASSQRWTIARGILKVMWITVEERRLQECLTEATVQLFYLNAVDNWGPDDHLAFDRCSYPNYAATDESGRKYMEMGELLQKAARLNLDC